MRFAPFAALAAMASAVFVMASPVPAPVALEVRAPEVIVARTTPSYSVNDVISKLQSDVAGPIAILNALNANTVTTAVVVEESNKIYDAYDEAVLSLIELQNVANLNLLFNLVGWVNTVLAVSGVSLDTLAALANVVPLLVSIIDPAQTLAARAEGQASIEAAAARISDLFYNFLGLFNGALGYLLSPVIALFTSSLEGNLEPLLNIIGPATYLVFQQTSGLLFLLVTTPGST